MQKLKSFVTGLVFLTVISACQEEDVAPECTTEATVRDLTRLDGCGWVLELEDGNRLEPYLPYAYADPLWCGMISDDETTSPRSSALWYDANPQDGMKVRIAYEVLADQISTCMVGDVAEITCLEVIERPPLDTPAW